MILESYSYPAIRIIPYSCFRRKSFIREITRTVSVRVDGKSMDFRLTKAAQQLPRGKEEMYRG